MLSTIQRKKIIKRTNKLKNRNLTAMINKNYQPTRNFISRRL